VDLVLPDGDVLLDLPLHLVDEGLAHATRDICAANLPDAEVEAKMAAFFVDRSSRPDVERFDRPLKRTIPMPKP